MKRSKKYSRIGWILALASVICSIVIYNAFGLQEPRPLNEIVVHWLHSALIGGAVYFWGKGDSAKELGA